MFSTKVRMGKQKFDGRDNRKKPMTSPEEWKICPKIVIAASTKI